MNWKFDCYRKEWICEHGVGHYDPFLNKYTTHGCEGCCGRDDFPGNVPLENRDTNFYKR
jgi:hypothetical protein